jgi:hypothetical protein
VIWTGTAWQLRNAREYGLLEWPSTEHLAVACLLLRVTHGVVTHACVRELAERHHTRAGAGVDPLKARSTDHGDLAAASARYRERSRAARLLSTPRI